MGTAARYSLPTPSCIPASEFHLDSTRFRDFVYRIESICRIRRRVHKLIAEFPIRALDVREQTRRASPLSIGSESDPFGGLQGIQALREAPPRLLPHVF